ncbi:NADP-dependent oxidoreductase [Streptacidiphilus pinicola]|uniref:NADP-dependent oxidoreductase n=1 Tax=Streptacidiphilus pinicola TaxID=2219663 RepID=A0A2X0IWT7_9ACTN|nr:NADP-dependent oxidoreductase [Streptacidiphilus pinicola]RAG82216.1 NADP-dependent oxidoreductase [Streptacidiphilus pinicola]
MRAVIQQSFGGPEVLEVVTAERPKPLSGEVLVRVRASGVNPVDLAVRSGAFPLLGEPPFVLGWDISGEVVEAGPGARYEVGEEVYGMPFFPRAASGYAEYVAAPSRQLARKPATIDHVHAAALPLAALTAWQGLVDGTGLKPGDRVLVERGAGGVGHLAVQIAKAQGAYVVAVASEERREFLTGLGADEVVDYRSVDVAATVRDIDVVLDSTAQAEHLLPVLRPGGTLVSLLEHGAPEVAERVRAAGYRFKGVSVEPDYAALEAIAALVDAGRLKPFVQHTFDLADAGKAHEAVATGHVQGKIVLTV